MMNKKRLDFRLVLIRVPSCVRPSRAANYTSTQILMIPLILSNFRSLISTDFGPAFVAEFRAGRQLFLAIRTFGGYLGCAALAAELRTRL
jgi:hypothetical protein